LWWSVLLKKIVGMAFSQKCENLGIISTSSQEATHVGQWSGAKRPGLVTCE
jgi:hypothetical protein